VSEGTLAAYLVRDGNNFWLITRLTFVEEKLSVS